MNVSVLLPSRGNPEGFRRVCENLSELASDPSQFEIVLMVDSTDPRILDYRMSDSKHPRHLVTLTNSKIKGYGNLHKMFDECARHASGDVLIAYNDDVVCETKDWDHLYYLSGKKYPFRPICHEIKGDHFHWAFPAITRLTHNTIGRFCPDGLENFDRVWHATANAINNGWLNPMESFFSSGVTFNHHRTDPEHGSEDRKQYIRGVIAEWDARQRIWDEAGRKVAELLK
jgi:hypothetical protein